MGKEIQDCDICALMVVVPPGLFMMGSPESEESRHDYEGPQHQVPISNSFGVGQFEVTFREWDACRSEGESFYYPDDHGGGRENRPVTSISWEDATEHLNWLSCKTGEQYRLLSESEWEYIARAGTTGPFHFGSTISSDQANFDGRYAYGESSLGIRRSAIIPVGGFPSNGIGLYDVHGNVRECSTKGNSRNVRK